MPKPKRERLLFICTYNQSRSFTAERLFQDHTHYDARSAGTHRSAGRQVTARLLAWADRVIVMEETHHAFLRARFPEYVARKTVVCLDIPDEFQPLSDDLVKVLTERLRDRGIEWEEPLHQDGA
jgi:predicted protein tyrosine phosphatase